MESDETIVANVQAGDAEAFGEIITRYEPKLRRYGGRFLGRTDDITDMVQDVFIKAYSSIQSFTVTERFSPWIYRIAHNTFVNELRRQSRFRFGIFDIDTESFFPTLAAPEQTDGTALAHDLRIALDTHLDRLSPKDREILLLSYYEDLSYTEISDVLHIPISAVGVRIHRAKARLKQLLITNPLTP